MATLTFGPEWLRNLTSSSAAAAGATSSSAGASSPAAASSVSVGSGGLGALAFSSNPAVRYKQADRRYGREEMLAHYQPTSDIPVELQDLPFIMCIKSQPPLALEPMSNDEQNLLLQCVNSVPMMRASGRGTNSGRGGRGEYDRGRGRGRGREDDALGKMRNRDGWDDRGSKGFDRGFSMYGVDDGPSGASPREVSRSISIESWRDNRQHVNDEELDSRKPERDRWYDVPKDRYGPKNWREPRVDQGERHDFDDSRRGRPPTEAIRKIEYKRSRSSGSTSFDDEAFQNALPEWSTANPQEVESVGTFDSSGAFMPVKENSVTKSSSDAAPPGKDANGKSSSATSSPDLPPTVTSNPTSSSVPDVQRLPLKIKDLGPVNSSQEVFNGLATGSSSSVSLSPVLQQRLDAGGMSFQQMPIDSVNNRTVDGAVSERTATALQKQSGAAAGVSFTSGYHQTADICVGAGGPVGGSLKMDSLSMPNTDQAATNVVDFVSKWTAENEANLMGKASQADDHGNDQWFYKDPQDDIQGPFTNAEMNDWLRTGYFTMSLLVRRGYEGDFCRLGEMIKTLGYVPFDPRPAAVSTVYNNPPLPLAPVVSGLSQHQLQQQLQQKQQLEQQLQQKQQLEQQLQQKQQLEQLRKIQHQQLLAIQQQHQGLIQQDYIRHIQMIHQQQYQQLLLRLQQPQPGMPQPQDGFGLMMPPHDPMLAASTLPMAGIHPAALTSSSELYAHLLQPAMTHPAVGCIPSTVPATVSIPSRPEVTVSSKNEPDVPTTVEQIEKLQFLELEREREDRRMEEMQRLERGHLEEERRIQERIVEEIRQQKLDEMRKVEFERKQLEEERRKLGELQRLVEQDRLLIAQKNQAEKLEKERKLMEKREEERFEREHLEKEQLEMERLQFTRMEEERVMLEQKKMEEHRRREAEDRKKRDELDAKQKAEAETKRKAEADARKRAESEAKQRAEAETRKRAEAEAKQRAEAEARQREEDERKRQLQASPAKSPWTSNNGKASKGSNLNSLTLAQIQEAERLQQSEEQHLRQLEQQRATAAAVAMEQSRQTALTWTATKAQPPAWGIPSLLEIQQEQAKQLQEGGHSEKAQLLSTKVAESSASSAWLAGGAPPVQWNKGGGGGGGSWQTQEPIGRKKISAPASDNSSQFPALGASSLVYPTKKSAAKAEKVVAKTKKEEAVVQKLFEVTKVRDELTEWCEDVLSGLRTSVDIPTLVDLLKDIDSPQEVAEYARMYLGESKQVRDFTQQFLDRRSKLRNSVQKQKPEENPWLTSSQPIRSQPPAVAEVSRQMQRSKPAAVGAAATQKPVVQDDGDKSKGKKKKKMQKVDSSILGFNVCADSDRKNVGQIDKV